MIEQLPDLQELLAGLSLNNTPTAISEQTDEVLEAVLDHIQEMIEKPECFSANSTYFHNIESLLRSVKSIKELYVGKPN